ncbi:MAG TPA: 4-alpha-glucanotransferase [Anaerolineae bacterium]
MQFPRASGILLHPTSLPGRFGIGDLGDASYRFIDFLAETGQQLWQIMPLGPTGYGDSPYQALSAFAGNPLLISLDRLVAEHCLAWWDLEASPAFPSDTVDYGPVIAFKSRLLRLSFQNFQATAADAEHAALAEFAAANNDWLDDYALFAALKEAHGGAHWRAWGPELVTRRPEALAAARRDLAPAIAYQRYLQFQFVRQWTALKVYASARGVRIIGDLPIFVADDSADAWAHPDQFYFDALGRPTLVAGIPPDYFSPTGQRWGNPVYRWDAMAADGYAWWIGRFRTTLRLVDVVRLDHFRGFVACWAVPADAPTAVEGHWHKGPGAALFRAAEAALGPLPLIAEDLGLITPRVEALLADLGCPGMRVLQFAFGDTDSRYLPHNYTHNTVVYTGTHDNDTTRGWWLALSPTERTFAQKYLARHGDDIHWDLIRAALGSIADIALFPLQDVLGIGSDGRMNTPGKATGNWGWRFREEALDEGVRRRLAEMTLLYGRAPAPRAAAVAGGGGRYWPAPEDEA